MARRAGVRLFNGGEVEERTELIYPDTVEAVVKQIASMGEGLLNARVEFERDPDPHGGFDDTYVSVTGRRS